MSSFTNAKNIIHRSFVDPNRDSYKSDEDALNIYRKTVQDISEWIDNLKL